MNLILALLLCPAYAQESAPPSDFPQMSAPLASAGVTELHDRFIESIDDAKKNKVLEELVHTPPQSTRDIQSLFDLFMRFSDTAVRDAALGSLALTEYSSPDLDVLLVHYLQQPEPEAQLFAIKASVRVRDAKALPIIQKMAESKFAYKSANEATLLAQKNAWWVQYEALAALAQWDPDGAMPLLEKKSVQAPEVARLMGRFLWSRSLPVLLDWAGSSSKNDQERGRSGLAAPAPTPELRQTRDKMLEVLRDPKAPREARHQLALKIGLCSTHEEMAALAKEYDGLKSDEDRLMFKTALFASRDRVAVPLLVETAKGDPEPRNRAGAVLQLKDMLEPKELRPVLQHMASGDTDPDNREMAARELKLLGKP